MPYPLADRLALSRPPDPAYLGFLAPLDPSISALALRARRTVLAAAPDAAELAYDAYNAVALAFTFTGRQREAFAHIAAYPGHVNLGFNQGATLPDPSRRLRGTGKFIRHVRLSTGDDLADAAIRALIEAAVANAARPLRGALPRTLVRRTTGTKRRSGPPAS